MLVLFLTLISTSGCEEKSHEKKENTLTTLSPGVRVVYPFQERLPFAISEEGDVSTRVLVADPVSNVKQILMKVRGKVSGFSVSDDGRYAAFVRASDPLDTSSRTEVYLLSIETSEFIQVSEEVEKTFGEFSKTVFSPDNKYIAFTLVRGTRGGGKLYVYSIPEKKLISPPALEQDGIFTDENPPTFIEGGARIVTTIKDYSPGFNDYARGVVAFGINDDDFITLASFDRDTKLGVPVGSPDGEYIYFSYQDLDYSNHRIIMRVPIDGGVIEKVFEKQNVLYIAGFLPGGQKALLSYHVQELMRKFVAIGDVETGEIEFLTSEDEDIMLFTGTGLDYTDSSLGMIIAHSHDLIYDYRDIIVMDFQGETRTNISRTETYDEEWAVWMNVPDGVQIPTGGFELD